MPAKLSRASKWALGLASLLAIALASKWFNQNPPVSAAQTSPEAADLALRTRFVDAPWREVVDAAQSALGAQKSYGRPWKTGQNSIVGVLPGQKLRQELRAEVPVLIFTDDLTVSLSEEPSGQIRVDCASKSRIGRGDFGENRRHVLQFLRAFEAELAK